MPQSIPENYQPLAGSERRRGRYTIPAGLPDSNETVSITLMVRRRPDGPPMPDHDYWARTPLEQRTYLSVEEFAERYGAGRSGCRCGFRNFAWNDGRGD
jgi:kumamolisin